MTDVAFLGAGLIGSGMVEGLVRRGDRVRVWNRTPAKARALAALGAEPMDSPARAVDGASRVHLALTDDAAVDEVLATIGPHLAPSTVVVDHTTTSPARTSARFALPLDLLHAPVFMSPQMCRESKGLMLCAGPSARFERVRGALAAMTGDLWWVGERTDLAAAYKLIGNAMILSIVGGLADVFAMGGALGIDPAAAHAVFSRFKPAGTLELRGARMAQGDFAPSFALSMARKDVRLMLEMVSDERVLTVLPALARAMDARIAAGEGDADVGVLASQAAAPR